MVRRIMSYLGLLVLFVFSSQLFAQQYIIIGWNDLGMHCANKDFQTLAVLPPYNNMTAQVIQVGDANSLPQVMANGLRVTYEIPGNTYSVGKTNFWSYEDKLFGVSLPDNIGLKGAGLSGDMGNLGDHFFTEGIPLTPYPDNDLTHEHPYQLALLKVYDASNNLLAQTQPVIPVSNEINCVSSGCHSSEQAILNAHENEGGFNPTNTPILCANCHADNALGTTGVGEAPPFSEAIHSAHAGRTNDCYKCHPGPNTQCLRGAMYQKGMVCQDCHGDLANVAQTIRNGREPWLQEPSCGASQCHGSNYAEEPGKLFRQSKGHGGLYCSACHGSPHAILPTVQDNDNVQNIALQGYAGTLDNCVTCHGVVPQGPGPHGFVPTEVRNTSTVTPQSYLLGQNYPNPFNPATTIPFHLEQAGKVHLAIFNSAGQEVATVIDRQMPAGEYTVKFNAGDLPTGMYFYRLDTGSFSQTKQMMLVK